MGTNLRNQLDIENPDHAALWELLDANDARMVKIVEESNGQIAQLRRDPAERAALVLELLLDQLVGMTPERVEMEKELALRMADDLDLVESQIEAHKKAQFEQQLLAGVGVSPETIAKMRDTGG